MKSSTPRRSGPLAVPVALAALVALLAALAAAVPSTPAEAACVCRCVDGRAKAVCSSGTDIPPVCSATACPMTAPRVSPMDAAKPKPDVKPGCSVKQVYDPKTGRYEWAQLCQ